MGKIMKIKKKLSVMFAAMMMFLTISSGINTVSAEDNSEELFTQEQYEEGRKEGWIGEDTSLEDMQQLNKDSAKLEKELDENPSFIQVYSSTSSTSRASNTFRAGDIIITNGVTYPILGHAGIFVGKNTILSIDGFKKHPSTKTFSRWKSDYNKGGKWTKVYRCSTSSYGPIASDWAMKHYYRSNAKYAITQNIKSTSETYCSKIVYQAYLYGVGKKAIGNPLTRGYVPPYDLPITIRNCKLRHTYK